MMQKGCPRLQTIPKAPGWIFPGRSQTRGVAFAAGSFLVLSPNLQLVPWPLLRVSWKRGWGQLQMETQEWGIGNGERGIGNGEQGIGNEEQGMGNGELGMRNRERGTGNGNGE